MPGTYSPTMNVQNRGRITQGTPEPDYFSTPNPLDMYKDSFISPSQFSATGIRGAVSPLTNDALARNEARLNIAAANRIAAQKLEELQQLEEDKNKEESSNATELKKGIGMGLKLGKEIVGNLTTATPADNRTIETTAPISIGLAAEAPVAPVAEDVGGKSNLSSVSPAADNSSFADAAARFETANRTPGTPEDVLQQRYDDLNQPTQESYTVGANPENTQLGGERFNAPSLANSAYGAVQSGFGLYSDLAKMAAGDTNPLTYLNTAKDIGSLAGNATKMAGTVSGVPGLVNAGNTIGNIAGAAGSVLGSVGGISKIASGDAGVSDYTNTAINAANLGVSALANSGTQLGTSLASTLGSVMTPVGYIAAAEAPRAIWGGRGIDYADKTKQQRTVDSPLSAGTFLPGLLSPDDSAAGRAYRNMATLNRVAMAPIDYLFGEEKAGLANPDTQQIMKDMFSRETLRDIGTVIHNPTGILGSDKGKTFNAFANPLMNIVDVIGDIFDI